MATHMLVVRDHEEFLKKAEEMGVNGEGQDKAICLMANGSNIHHAFAYRKPLIIHMIVPTIDCAREVQLTVQQHEGLGAEVMV